MTNLLLIELRRIANALEALAQASAPAAPNYQFPFEEYPTFDWARINATVTARDQYGATVVNWGGHTWKRRSWPQKFGLVIGFTRPDGMGEDGVNWLNLISFKQTKGVEPLDDKVTDALSKQRPARPVQPPPVVTPPPAPSPKAEIEKDWEQDARTCKDPLIFDTAVVKAVPWFTEVEKVATARESMFGVWVAENASAYLAGLKVYAQKRQELEKGGAKPLAAHKAAVAEAGNKFRQMVQVQA